MSVLIFGPPQSTYVRSVRMVCVEKAVPYELKNVEFGSADHTALHPFARIPVMRDRDFVLCESGAIARYIDQVFDGPALQPKGPRECGIMNQWISAISDYYYDTMIRQVVLPRLGIMPLDESAVAALQPKLAHQLGVVDRDLGQRRFLACDELTLADLFLAPILAYVMKVPEGRAIPDHEHLSRWMGDVMQRPSFVQTDPNRPAGA